MDRAGLRGLPKTRHRPLIDASEKWVTGMSLRQSAAVAAAVLNDLQGFILLHDQSPNQPGEG